MIGCRCPARGTDADHTQDHARAGPTIAGNLGHACRHDHLLKHEGGWRLDQPTPGQFRWTSRLGHRYLVPPRPIIEPLPDPIVRSGPAPALVVPCHPDLGMWKDSPSEHHTTPPAPPRDPDDDLPPF